MYENFAGVYDRLMEDAEYGKRCGYILSLFENFDRLPTLMLDLCCGTGSFSELFSEKGISVIGVDASAEMLSAAAEKSVKSGREILYLCQDAGELDLYGTVDGAVCLMDSLNHMTDFDALCRVLSRVSLFLERDRLFIFDVNTEYKAASVLGDNTFVADEGDIFLSWRNEYYPDDRISSMLLDFFVRDSGGGYTRRSESVTERVYSDAELQKALSAAGLKIEAVFDDMKKTPPTDTSQRVFYVTRKI